MSNSDIFQPNAAIVRKSHISSMNQYKDMYKKSIEQPNEFWKEIAEQFHWEEPLPPVDEFYSYNFDITKGPISIKWMEGATTNICYNVLDRNISNGLGDKIAFFWEGNDPEDYSRLTYKKLLEEVCRFANVLKSHGFNKGDRVSVCMPMILEAVVTMLACARIGAVHSIVARYKHPTSVGIHRGAYESGSLALVLPNGRPRTQQHCGYLLANGNRRQCPHTVPWVHSFKTWFCGARRDEDGYLWVTGRVDDMIAVSGSILSPVEVESALVEHPSIAEAAVVAHSHPVKGECFYCFITPNEGIEFSTKLCDELKKKVHTKIASFVNLEVIQHAPLLPKTRSGKIMRRVLRKVADNDRNLGDLSTLVDEGVVETLFQNRPENLIF